MVRVEVAAVNRRGRFVFRICFILFLLLHHLPTSPLLPPPPLLVPTSPPSLLLADSNHRIRDIPLGTEGCTEAPEKRASPNRRL